MDKLTCIRLFTEVAKRGSFTHTANALNMTQSAVSKKIAWLEQHLGFTLFHRTSRAIALTTSGKTYLKYSQSLLDTMSEIEHQIRDEQTQISGHIKISAPSAFATQRLADPLCEFMHRYPKVTLDVSVSDQHVDLINEDVDIAIRASALKDSGLKAKKLLDHDACYFAAPQYLKLNGTPSTPESLLTHRCITYALSNPSNIWQLDNKHYTVNEYIRSDSPEMIVKLALSGLGVAAMPSWMVDTHLAEGTLIKLFEDRQGHTLPMYALYKHTEFMPTRLRTMLDFLHEYFTN
ncbi:LysR family transcriptional regulator [Pseudoalteromonas sp. R3]|uniref:LysR family transcriptional regulator n=1 Tax=Pseudoalteromonas sp. R3 TaxID=1709477 RepID=UPI0006B4AC1D|nr:LysR family transcriptional regulator [Pseudoalteromonas sp. R3]AZZ96493.1 LysR family transcriptional regulator [Pseudoalteromonas sp. R3]